MKTIVKPFDQVAIRGARRGHHLRRVLGIAGEGFLHQHVFAIRECGRAPLQVLRRRQRDIDEVDVIARHQF